MNRDKINPQYVECS